MNQFNVLIVNLVRYLVLDLGNGKVQWLTELEE